MKISKTLFPVLLLFVLGFLPKGWAQTKEEATLSSVKGHVKILNLKGSLRRVKSGQVAHTGETIQVGSESAASVQLPDGSALSLYANTHLTITSLTQPSALDKIFMFRLGVGKVLAQVRKLMSSKSSFEIEAGGVVCGVRGTEFAVGYNVDTKQMDLDVFSGAVAACGGGVTQVFSKGHSGHFMEGHWDGKVGIAPPPPPKDSDNGSSTSSGTNGSGTSGDNSSDSGVGDKPASGNTGTNGTPSGDDHSSTVGGNGTGGNSGGSSNPSPGLAPSGIQPSATLGDLDSQFMSGILINGDNCLNSAQQRINIHLVVPGKEVAP
jgi:hypothetical protein